VKANFLTIQLRTMRENMPLMNSTCCIFNNKIINKYP
jgi:hypothetical protein